MPRWPKTAADYDSEIEKTITKINRLSNNLEDERKRLEDLQSQKRDFELNELYSYMQEKGLVVSDVIEKLQSQ